LVPDKGLPRNEITTLMEPYSPGCLDDEEIMRFRQCHAEVKKHSVPVITRLDIHGVDAHFSHPFQIFQNFLDHFSRERGILSDQIFDDGPERLLSVWSLCVFIGRSVPIVHVEIPFENLLSFSWDCHVLVPVAAYRNFAVQAFVHESSISAALVIERVAVIADKIDRDTLALPIRQSHVIFFDIVEFELYQRFVSARRLMPSWLRSYHILSSSHST